MNVFTLIAATASLFLIGKLFAISSCWAIYFPLALAAWPIWVCQRERALLHRRAVLASVAVEDGVIRRWLWAGRLILLWQVLVSLVLALVLLAFLPLLSWHHWAVLGVDALLLAMFAITVRQRLTGQIKSEYLGTIGRMWPLFWLNVATLAVGFVIIDFFLLGAPNTTREAWHIVAERAFEEGSGAVSCQLAGWATGALMTVDRLAWHAAQVLIPHLPGIELRLVAWGVLLLQAGVLGYAFTRYLLGVLALLERRQLRLSTLTGDSAVSKAFVLTILVLALPYFYAAYKLRDFDPKALSQGAESLVSWTDPCKPDRAALDVLEANFGTELKNVRAAVIRRTDQDIDQAVTEIFAEAEQGVDRYLDWYFSVIGEYQRLAAAATGNFAEKMTKELNQHLFEQIHFAERIEDAHQRIVQSSQQQLAEVAERFGGTISKEAQTNPCKLQALDMEALGNLDRDRYRATVAAGGGALAGTAAVKLMTKKAAGAFMGKVAAKKSFKVAAGMAGKVAGKKAGSILLSSAGAAAVCSPGGPLAVLCGIGAGVATWITIDKASIEIEEKMFREELRAEILQELEVYKAELAQALKLQQYAAIQNMTNTIQDSVKRTFIPRRDGL